MKKSCIAACILVLVAAGVFAVVTDIRPKNVLPGRCFSINLSAEGTTRVRIGFSGQTVECYPEKEGFKGIIGIPCDYKPGRYKLTVSAIKLDGHEEKIDRLIEVVKTKFPSVSFCLKPAKKKLFVRDLIQQEWARIERRLVVESPEKKWEGLFILPAEGRVSMRFGTIERVNGKRGGQHRGIDIAVPTGTKIAAANHGKVVFSEKLQAFGNTVVIDHGRGVHSLYFHLSKLLASAGEEVEKGSIIGLSGNTGISSGPHLHWGMSVHNLRVDPGQWMKTNF